MTGLFDLHDAGEGDRQITQLVVAGFFRQIRTHRVDLGIHGGFAVEIARPKVTQSVAIHIADNQTAPARSPMTSPKPVVAVPKS